MRVTSSMYYKNLYATKNDSLQSNLFDVNKQIASGLKIQYAKDDVVTFTETMRLDNELAGLGQVKMSTENGYKISNQTDVLLNEFDTSINRMRVLLIKAANASNSDLSLDAIAAELRTVEQHFYNLANSSINGQYLFSGSAVDVKPISSDGTYNGNSVALNSFTGTKTTQQYNVSGEELFLGEKYLVSRQVTSNVVNNNLVHDFPVGFADGEIGVVTKDSTIRELMGDTDAPNPGVPKHHFYVRGTQSDGTSFNQEIVMSDEQPITSLMDEIEKAYGVNTVDVSMNAYGEFVIQDKFKGSSKIEFNMVGAVDIVNGGVIGADTASISDVGVYGATAGQIQNLDNGESDFNNIVNATSVVGNPNLHVKEFVKSELDSSVSSLVINIDALQYDRTEFTTEGSLVSSNVPQIIKKTKNDGGLPPVELIAVEDRNKFATASTLLENVASGATIDSLNGTTFKLEGFNANSVAFDVDISLSAAGSTFTVNTPVAAGPFDIFNMANPRVAVDSKEMTYQHLMDVMNMAITGIIPGAATDIAYDAAITAANNSGEVKLSHDGKIQFQDKINSNTPAKFSLYDINSGDFTQPPSAMTFNVNNAVMVRDPKTDFFSVIDQMITAVENYTLYPDADSVHIRNIGMENAIAMMDDLSDHVLRAHAQAGAQSTSLLSSIERTSILEIGAMTLRSSVIDTDLAEASLTLSQLTINYESMLSTVGKVSKLNLVNYL